MRAKPKDTARGHAHDGARTNRLKRPIEPQEELLPKKDGPETAAEKLERSRQLNLAAQARYRRKLAVGPVHVTPVAKLRSRRPFYHSLSVSCQPQCAF